ncbi:MAG: insulinase family protein [Alphaproteobacteria bacterium]|nr:insulinase family protein [Alphaproteobacteria bacterium]
MFAKAFFAFLFGSLIAFCAENETELPHLNIEERTIENGLRVVVYNTGSKGVVCSGVGYFVGSADDPRDVFGISHVLEHMMFQGTKNLSGADLQKIVFVGDIYSNAFTSYDMTLYYHLSNKPFLDTALKIEAERMQNLLLDEKTLKSELEVITEERKMRTESDPLTNFVDEASSKCLYLFSSYSYPVIGYVDQIKSCTAEKIREHYRKFYRPNNAFVILVGDITMDEALKLVQKHFGSIKSGTPVKRSRVIDPANTGLCFSIDHSDKNISIRKLDLVFRVDRSMFDNVKKLATLEIAASILGDGDCSVLGHYLIDRRHMALSVGASVDVRAFDKGHVILSFVCNKGSTGDDIDYIASKIIIYPFADTLLTKELFEKEKTKMLEQIDILEDNPQSAGMFVLPYIINGYNLQDVKKLRSIIQNISLDDVKRVAKSLFTKENRALRVYNHPKE